MSHFQPGVRSAFVAAILCSCMATASHAARLKIDAGLLVGATNVRIDNALYDVEFLDGSCEVVFTSCDEGSDFAFSTEDAARNATIALRDQVFIDSSLGMFDSMPSLIAACVPDRLGTCQAVTPYGIRVVDPPDGFGNFVDRFGFENSGGPYDRINIGSTRVWFDPDHSFFAKWTPSAAIPEPSSALLFALGTAVVASQARRTRRVK